MTVANVSIPPLVRKPPEVRGEHALLGHLPAFRRDMARWLLDVAKTEHDLALTPLGLIRRVVTVNSPALANEVLVTKQDAFVKSAGLGIFLRPLLGDGLLTSEGGTHERQRRLLAPAFMPKRMSGYARAMSERSTRFLDGLADGARIDVARAMMSLTLSIVGKTLFDAEVEHDASAVGDALTTAMEVSVGQLRSVVPLPPVIPSPGNLRYRSAVKRLDEIIFRIIRERRGQSEDRGDVLSILLAARDEDGTQMTDQQIRDESMTLFLAGHETTANALSWAFYLLAEHPHAREKMEAEIDRLGHVPTYEDLKQLPYTLAVFKEAMRLYPPAYILGRRAIRDVVIGDHAIKKYSVVFINIMGIHRRPDLWPDPERFLPERFLDGEQQRPRGAYLPFGAGPRVCIGNHFALTEGQLLLATIAQRVRFERTSDAPIDLEPLVTLRPKGELDVKVVFRA